MTKKRNDMELLDKKILKMSLTADECKKLTGGTNVNKRKEFQLSGPSAAINHDIAILKANNCSCSCACGDNGSGSGSGSGFGNDSGNDIDWFSILSTIIGIICK